MKYFILLCFILGSLSINAEETITTQTNNLIDTSGESTILVAKKKKRRKKRKKRRRRRRKKKAYVNTAESVSRVYSQKGVKVGAGLAMLSGEQPFILFGDYIHPFRDKMAFVAGASFWTISNSGVSSTLIHADAGLGYHINISDKMNIEVGGRGGMSRASVSGGGISGSETWLTLIPYGTFNFLLGNSAIGVDVRKPIFLSGNNSGFDGFYLMGFYRFFF